MSETGDVAELLVARVTGRILINAYNEKSKRSASLVPVKCPTCGDVEEGTLAVEGEKVTYICAMGHAADIGHGLSAAHVRAALAAVGATQSAVSIRGHLPVARQDMPATADPLGGIYRRMYPTGPEVATSPS